MNNGSTSRNDQERRFPICKDHVASDWNQPDIDDEACVLCRLFYLEAQESLLEEWQQRAKRAEDAIAEIKRPLDEQMARLNATVARQNAEIDRLTRSEKASVPTECPECGAGPDYRCQPLLPAKNCPYYRYTPSAVTFTIPGPIPLAVWFHETYERLAPRYDYETKPETRVFDASTANGRLMIAVMRELRDMLESRVSSASRAIPASCPQCSWEFDVHPADRGNDGPT